MKLDSLDSVLKSAEKLVISKKTEDDIKREQEMEKTLYRHFGEWLKKKGEQKYQKDRIDQLTALFSKFLSDSESNRGDFFHGKTIEEKYITEKTIKLQKKLEQEKEFFDKLLFLILPKPNSDKQDNLKIDFDPDQYWGKKIERANQELHDPLSKRVATDNQKKKLQVLDRSEDK